MSLPILAIVGRPNVGKSRLFNRLTGKFKALVDDTSGVTRDRHYGYGDWAGKNFIVVDTGGLIPGSEDPLNKKVWGQVFLAIQEADILICLFDGQTGLTGVDEVLVGELRKIAKPNFFVVNKIDAAAHEQIVADFARLGVEPLIPVSAEHGRGISDLLEALAPFLQGSPQKESDAFGGDLEKNTVKRSKELRLSIVGRPNVGKSTLLNQLAGEERVIVHEMAGTTRDAIDVTIERGNQSYLFVDTAGIKKKNVTKTRLEKFTVLSSLKAIEQSQIVLLLIDATEGLTHHDLHLAYHVWNGGKGLILLVNKWDLIPSSPSQFEPRLRPQLGELQSIPILCISAQSGRNCHRIWHAIAQMEKNLWKRVETSQLNQWLEAILEQNPLPAYRGRSVRIYYGTQVAVAPPRIVLFSNEPKGVKPPYQRFLKHQLTEAMGIAGVPIQLSIRSRGGRK